MDLEDILKKLPMELEELKTIDLSSYNLNTLDDIKFYSLCNAIMFCSNLEILIVCNPVIVTLSQHKLNALFYAVGTLSNLKQLDLSYSELNQLDENSFKLLCNALANIRTRRSPKEELSLNIDDNNFTTERLIKLKALANIPESIITTNRNPSLKLSF